LRRGSPLPIPNRVVKPACANGTAICGRVGRRLSLNPHHLLGEDFFMDKKYKQVLKVFDISHVFDGLREGLLHLTIIFIGVQ
jgi:hypothetical protein